MRRIFGRMLAACAQLRRPNEPVSVFNVRNEPTLYQFWMSVDTLNLLAQGRGAEALAEVLREPEEWMRPWALAIIHHAEGHRAESDAALQALIARYQDGAAYQVAQVYAARSELELAFQWLEHEYDLRNPGVGEMKCEPLLRSLSMPIRDGRHSCARWGWRTKPRTCCC
jgi:hypothetical protein